MSGLTRRIQHPAKRLGGHLDHQAPLTIPLFDRLHDISIGWQHRTVGGDVMDRPMQLIQYENRWPAMMVQRLFVMRLQSNIEDAEPVVFE